MKRARPDLTRGPIARTLIAFALPILGTNVLQSVNVSINSIWIGRYLGEAALTASANANLVLFFLLGSVFGIAMASTLLVAQASGRKAEDEARRIFGTGLTFFMTLACLVAIVGFLLAPQILALMHTPADAVPYAIAYLRVIFMALPPIFLYVLLGMTLRGTGDSHTPFLFMLLSAGLDVSLNPLLIFGLGPVPAMGIAGSATATLIAQTVALVALLAHMRRHRHLLWLGRARLDHLKPDWTIVRAMVVKGLPMGLQMIVISSSSLVLIGFVNAYGSRVTAAYGAALQLWRYLQMPAIAVSSAVSSMVAQNVGAGLWQRVTRTVHAGLAANMLMTGVLVALILIFSRQALGLFLPADSAALAVGEHINRIVVWAFLLMSASFVLSGTVRATGAVIPPLLIMAFSLWVLRIPLAGFGRAWLGADAVWWSFPLAALSTLILSALYYRFGRWREARLLRDPTSVPGRG